MTDSVDDIIIILSTSDILSIFVFIDSNYYIYDAPVILGCLYMFGPKSIYILKFTYHSQSSLYFIISDELCNYCIRTCSNHIW